MFEIICRIFFKKPKKMKRRILMGKVDVVAAQLAAVQQGQTDVLSQALGACFDAGEADGNGPGFTQADIDAAVAAAVAPLNDQVAALQAQDAADVQVGTDAKAALADLQSKFDALSQKEGVESGIISGLQSSLATLQAIVNQLTALQPVPVPDPAPTPDAGQ
jgi:hypothetical protein